jgi:hypothetical protein
MYNIATVVDADFARYTTRVIHLGDQINQPTIWESAGDLLPMVQRMYFMEAPALMLHQSDGVVILHTRPAKPAGIAT